MDSTEKVVDTTNPLYQLLEKQATEFELFGQRLKSEIQNSYEFIKLQTSKQIINSHTDQTTTSNEQTNLKPVQIISNHVISTNEELRKELESMKVRIEELETDSIIKSQDIEKQKVEIKQLKEELNKKDTTTDIKKLKQEIDELNEFKFNFMSLFDTLGSELSELKIKFEQNEFFGDSLIAEKLQLNEIKNESLKPRPKNNLTSRQSFKTTSLVQAFETLPNLENNVILRSSDDESTDDEIMNKSFSKGFIGSNSGFLPPSRSQSSNVNPIQLSYSPFVHPPPQAPLGSFTQAPLSPFTQAPLNHYDPDTRDSIPQNRSYHYAPDTRDSIPQNRSYHYAPDTRDSIPQRRSSRTDRRNINDI